MLVWPLTGRDEELDFVAGALEGVGRGGVVLYGDAGVGKTRLAWDALARVERKGVATRWAVGSATAAGIPLGALAHLVPGVQLPPGASPFLLLRQAIDGLVTEAGDRPLVVGVDDAHLLDPLSATLVQHLALSGSARVVLTVRSGEPVADALVSLWKDGVLDRLEISALTREQTAKLLEATLEGAVESVTAGHLWAVTRGNALFLRHLIEGEVEAGRLVCRSDIWRLRGSLAPDSALSELVKARLGGLDPVAIATLEHLALGEPLGVALIEHLLGHGALATLERRNLVTTETGRRRFDVRLAHPLYGEVLRRETPAVRAREIRAALATAMASHGLRREGDVLKAAVLRIDADDPADPILLAGAAVRALSLLDMALAERLGQAAVDAGAGFETRVVVSVARGFQGRAEEVNQDLERMEAMIDSDIERSLVAIMRVGTLFWTLRRPAEAERVLAEAEESVGRTGPAALELQGLRSALLYHAGRPQEAIRMGEEVLASSEASPMAEAWGAAAVACACARVGAADRSAKVAARGFEALRRAPHASVLWGAISWGDVNGDLLAGRLSEAAAKAQQCQERSLVAFPSGATAVAALTMGLVALSRGQVRTAVRWLREEVAAVAVAGEDPAAWGWLGRIHLTQALAMAGEAAGARQARDEAAAARHPSLLVHTADELLADAWVAAAQGAAGKSCALARDAAGAAAGDGWAAVEVHAWHALVRMGAAAEAAEAAEHLRALARVVQGPMASLAACHAAAAGSRDGRALDQVGSAFEDLGANLLAADAFAHASVAHCEAGRGSSASASGARARSLAERCEDARTPALVAADLPLPITGREREVALLAADGLSNRQIAERLVISVRTVESHLYQASAKLGVAGREGFAEALNPPPPPRP